MAAKLPTVPLHLTISMDIYHECEEAEFIVSQLFNISLCSLYCLIFNPGIEVSEDISNHPLDLLSPCIYGPLPLLST
jgi:hypothetical protein